MVLCQCVQFGWKGRSRREVERSETEPLGVSTPSAGGRRWGILYSSLEQSFGTLSSHLVSAKALV